MHIHISYYEQKEDRHRLKTKVYTTTRANNGEWYAENSKHQAYASLFTKSGSRRYVLFLISWICIVILGVGVYASISNLLAPSTILDHLTSANTFFFALTMSGGTSFCLLFLTLIDKHIHLNTQHDILQQFATQRLSVEDLLNFHCKDA